uniref:Uncharacterized protein AlNc14C222G9141 n=1 Tax=Albugo laibachii Nc14 TaxID=890382 RepID=F0WRZ9_9STRA|nr:conserved hypothetical protein [Albugo laibachii Nc14]|eukprot:CCA24116.1 conserved hypothetical protein [Albugo laibachii Nc14]
MSGSGRKSHYRKSVTQKVLDEYPEPRESVDEIVCVLASRGSNIFEVLHTNGEVRLTMLPQKYHKLIWIKRGDFLIVTVGDAEMDNKGAVKSLVLHILYKDQIKYLRRKELWPSGFINSEPGWLDRQRPVEDHPNDEASHQKHPEASSSDSRSIKFTQPSDAFYVNSNRRLAHVEDENNDLDEIEN